MGLGATALSVANHFGLADLNCKVGSVTTEGPSVSMQTAADGVSSEPGVRAVPAEGPRLPGHLCRYPLAHTEVPVREREGSSPSEGITLTTARVRHKPALLLLGNR